MEVQVYSIRWYSEIHNKNMVKYVVGNIDMDMKSKCEEHIYNLFKSTGTNGKSYNYEGTFNIAGLWEIEDNYYQISGVSGFSWK